MISIEAIIKDTAKKHFQVFYDPVEPWGRGGGGVAAGAGANFDPFFDSQMKAEVKSNQYKHKYQHRTKILHYGVDDPNLTKVRGAGLGDT